MIVGLDPHQAADHWYVYEYFPGTLENDRRRYPAAAAIREWMHAAAFSDCSTREVQRIRLFATVGHVPINRPE